MTDDIYAALAEGTPADLEPIAMHLCHRYGIPAVRALIDRMDAKDIDSPFREGIISAKDLPEATPPAPLWFGMYPRQICLLIGETGAGKSSLLYNIAVHAALDDALWGVPFGLNRPLRVLYIDPENSGDYRCGVGGLCSVRVDRINKGKPDTLFFHDGQGINLSDTRHMAALSELLINEQIDLVILDPLANLFCTKDENANSEAAQQMKSLNTLSRVTNACVVVAHHTGKEQGGNYGRGASARLAAADTALMFRARGLNDDADDDYGSTLRQRQDICRLQLVKNRWEGRGSLFLRMAGDDRFERVDAQAWMNTPHSAGEHGDRKADQAQEEIMALMMDGQERSRKDIIGEMEKERIGIKTTCVALNALVNRQVLDRAMVARGGHVYKLLNRDD